MVCTHCHEVSCARWRTGHLDPTLLGSKPAQTMVDVSRFTLSCQLSDVTLLCSISTLTSITVINLPRSRSPAPRKKDASNGAAAAPAENGHRGTDAAETSPHPADTKPSTTANGADDKHHQEHADTTVSKATANSGNHISNGDTNGHGDEKTAAGAVAHNGSSTAAGDDAMDLDGGDVIAPAQPAKAESSKAAAVDAVENGGKSEKRSSRHGSASPERRHKDKERDRGEAKKHHHHRSSKDKDKDKEGKRDKREKEKSSSRAKEGEAEAVAEAAVSKQDAVAGGGDGL